MKKNITINLFGTLYNIDEDAYQLLERYLESMKSYFNRQEGGEEIADDIEHRVAELLWEKREKEGMEAVNIDVIKEIMGKIGNPAEIDNNDNPNLNDTEEGDGQQSNSYSYDNAYQNAAHKAADQAKTGWGQMKGHFQNRRLFRDPSNKALGGVCSGLSHYLGIGDPIYLRLLLVLLFLWKGFGLLLYLILWLVIPEARTPEDRLCMKGEDVTPESLNEEILQGNHTAPSNGNGCLKALFFLLVLAPLGILLLTLLGVFAIAMGGLTGVAAGGFLGDALPFTTLSGTMNNMVAWSGVICLVIIICLLIWLVIRALRGGNKRMSSWAIFALIVIILGCAMWSIFAFTRTAVRIADEISTHAELTNTNDATYLQQKQADDAYLEANNFSVLTNNTSRCTSSGQYIEGNDTTRYLDAYDDDENIQFTAERTEEVAPGTYRLIVLARAEDEGAYIYVRTGDEEEHIRMSMITPYDSKRGPIWQYAKGKLTAQQAGIPASKEKELSGDEQLLKNIAEANGGMGYGWSYVVIDNIVVKKGETVSYGVTTDPELTKHEPQCVWFSACDFVLEKR